MYFVKGGYKQSKGGQESIKFKGRNNGDLKLIDWLHKLLKIPTYILSSIYLASSTLASDIAGIVISVVVMLLITTLGNDINNIKNFSNYLSN